jgi:hypothetical protein
MDPGAAPLTRLVQDDGAGDTERSEVLDIARFISGQALRSAPQSCVSLGCSRKLSNHLDHPSRRR